MKINKLYRMEGYVTSGMACRRDMEMGGGGGVGVSNYGEILIRVDDQN